jgi:hypothetical protein
VSTGQPQENGAQENGRKKKKLRAQDWIIRGQRSYQGRGEVRGAETPRASFQIPAQGALGWYESGLRPESRAPHLTAYLPKQVQKRHGAGEKREVAERRYAVDRACRVPGGLRQEGQSAPAAPPIHPKVCRSASELEDYIQRFPFLSGFIKPTILSKKEGKGLASLEACAKYSSLRVTV